VESASSRLDARLATQLAVLERAAFGPADEGGHEAEDEAQDEARRKPLHDVGGNGV
jgi:hypothetical protein